MKKTFIFIVLTISIFSANAQKKYSLTSPDEKLRVEISIGNRVSYTIQSEADTVIFPSFISMKLENEMFGFKPTIKGTKRTYVNNIIQSPFYKRAQITDNYNELRLIFKENFELVFRAYNEGTAYRFISTEKKDFLVIDEEAEFNLGYNSNAFVPYVRNNASTYEEQFFNSFENVYSDITLNQWDKARLAFSPIVVSRNNSKKIAIAESDLNNYPGMFLYNPYQSVTLKGRFAPYPLKEAQSKYNIVQMKVGERKNHIAESNAKSAFPWRIIIVAQNDKELADNDMVYKLASSSKVNDVSWIKPGKVAWDWWNDLNLSGVDFKTGVNNETYKYYIDFASRNKIEYVILDDGWSVRGPNDLFQVVPEIDLKDLIAYAKERNVGLILWAGYISFNKNIEGVCKHYSELGIKGFKIDFMDRDDQPMVEFHTRVAEIAAKYKLLIDFHGTYKPTGLNRTYPNVINFEAVHGLEQLKFPTTVDQVKYDVTIPFIRQIAGPMDYTQGAMRNSTKDNFRSVFSEPMSQGTRCRQLATYVIFESPLNMLCDSPTSYEKEQECTDFITSVPTVWDNTVAVDGKLGEYIVMARQKAENWYLGAMTNWDARTLEVDLSFLQTGNYAAEVFKDGLNADKKASDYKKEIIQIGKERKLKISMAPGGGYVMKIYPIGN
ncbi:MAG: Retaining alpha-galactosidase [Bacteroidales bacterium 45-6]|uniref:glycoside hydrolase family 97 protein n=1 Tax=uncultured Dysgonomonas sp. TaxID=206096 RepID=UPI00096521CC|nr:glycoside hydrolase family 97 protein [uncultured Dysgonomonas sp.]OJU53506.1 MAG: Retaining alpha-galactosidase [Bacteroidales bacterium 45-6]